LRDFAPRWSSLQLPPAAGGRATLALAMTRLRPVPDGGTGLYDTTLAAVRAV
jgi:hypothetical protein